MGKAKCYEMCVVVVYITKKVVLYGTKKIHIYDLLILVNFVNFIFIDIN